MKNIHPETVLLKGQFVCFLENSLVKNHFIDFKLILNTLDAVVKVLTIFFGPPIDEISISVEFGAYH